MNMHVLDYLYLYQNIDFREVAFNEVDALALALVSYFPFDELKGQKEIYSSDELLKRINEYVPPRNTNERKLTYIEIVKIICRSLRYKHARFAWFVKERDKVNSKQFQAITIILHDFAYVSFCGTDSTTLGWKEDFNMAYLETVPSEIEAVNYLKRVANNFFFKKMYVGGHSKGGRLAITAAKKLNKINKLIEVYSFDGPNYPEHCYDTEYKSILHLLREYTPDESIIGRLMNEYREKKIISSSNALLLQHDALSWDVDGHLFIRKEAYTPRSSHIVDTMNYALNNYDEDLKKDFIDTSFDFLEHLNMDKLPNEGEWLTTIVSKFKLIKDEWKNTPKEKRAVFKKMLFNLSKDYILKKKD